MLALLGRIGPPVGATVVPAGEPSKCVRELERLWRDLVRCGCDRSSSIITFGGGVVGDLAGFAAASVLRGVDFLQVPTTLLAMVDASVGGKTGINLPEGKNLVGAFHQPRAVVADLEYLRTLPERELRSGWAEVIKTAAIFDARLFRELERDRGALLRRSGAHLERVVARCVAIKAEVVRKDEREAGSRRLLNFGHTLGHGIEAVQSYGGLLHGEAVAVGMAFAAELGEALGITPPPAARRLTALLKAFALPTRISGLSADRLLVAMARDKKRGRRGLRWVLLRRLGEARIVEDVPLETVRERLREFVKRDLYTRHSALPISPQRRVGRNGVRRGRRGRA
jgi:3-dehydroquinate synthase